MLIILSIAPSHPSLQLLCKWQCTVDCQHLLMSTQAPLLVSGGLPRAMPEQRAGRHLLMAVIFACRFFSAADAKTLRAAVGTFYDLLGLATRTLEAFAPQEDDR